MGRTAVRRVNEWLSLIHISRPEMLENVEKYTEELPEFAYRLRMKAGLTGLAQISGKYNTSPKDKLVMDLMCIENYSIWQDIKPVSYTHLLADSGPPRSHQPIAFPGDARGPRRRARGRVGRRGNLRAGRGSARAARRGGWGDVYKRQILVTCQKCHNVFQTKT